MIVIYWFNFPYLGLFTLEGRLGQSMDSVLKVKAEKHGPKNVLKLGNYFRYSRTRKETDSTVREVDVTGTYSL